MLDPIILPTLYFITAIEVIFQIGVVFYAYKVVRITGSFRAWTLIIAAWLIVTVQSIMGLILTLTLPTDQLANLISSIGETTTILSSMINLVAGLLLFLGVFGLAKRFQSQAKPANGT
ncbi:MAG TPA: hypothetical protein VE177_02310 [Candidatus Binatus sp.]|nr:hypothetical protein [Candidatus Binatus sp.]